MSTHKLCFEQKYEKYQIFLSENFPVLVVKFSIYLNRRVFVMPKFLHADNEDSDQTMQMCRMNLSLCSTCQKVLLLTLQFIGSHEKNEKNINSFWLKLGNLFFTTLWAKSVHNKLMIFFCFYPENRI